MTLPGSPDEVLDDPARGTPCRISIEIPAALAMAPESECVELEIPAGSWILYDAARLFALER